MSVEDRLRIINELLAFSRPIHELTDELTSMGWDYEGKEVLLEKQHVVSVLHRYMAGRLTGADVESWANLIECREEIEFSREFHEELEEVLHELANPALTCALCPQRASALLQGFS
jgi:hypothetical protein